MRIAIRFTPLLLMAALSLAAASCRPLIKEAFRSPKIRVTDVMLTSNPLNNPREPWDFVLTLDVDNPNGYSLNISHVAYAAVLGRVTIADGDHRADIHIWPSRVTTVQVPLTVRPEAIQEAMRLVLQARHADYEFNGSVAVIAPVVGIVRVPFSKRGTFDPLDLLKKKGIGFN
ncbi:MAG: LEA type 2 family protein [Deltaproteobacteria bacterium]|nr:LEA type 2 family protein [Candidatus Deferrimicrobiaceae bacterium]